MFRLHGAAESGDLPHVVHIIEQEGWDVDMRKPSSCGTPLMPAASNAHLHVIDWLVEHGADVNARDEALWTPLHFGAKSGACVRRLLQLGANPLLESNEGDRPLSRARMYEDADAIEALEEAEAEAERTSTLLKARAMNDTGRTIQRVAQQAEERHASEVEKMATCTVVTPPYLRERVERGETLPRVVVEGEEEAKLGGVLRFVVPSDMADDEGGLPHALFLEAMDFLTPTWHPARGDVEPPDVPPRVVSPLNMDALNMDALDEIFADIDQLPGAFGMLG